MSIISCFCKQTNLPSDPNKVKIWHRLPQQMHIRCYLIEGQSQTKSYRKQLITSAHGNNSISYFITKQRPLEKMKTTLGTCERTPYVLNRQRQQRTERKKTGQRIVCCSRHMLTEIPCISHMPVRGSSFGAVRCFFK